MSDNKRSYERLFMRLIYCRGGDKSAPKVCARAGWLYGTRHDCKPYAMPVYMLDINWEKYVWADYVTKVALYKPTLAMVPDYFSDVPKSLLLERIAEVKEAGASEVMVCPKFLGAVGDIPDWCIVAISVPTDYAGFLPPAHEVQGRRLHLLGGYPDQWQYLKRYRYPQSNIVSADGNALALKAQRGMWWSARKADWIQAPRGQYKNISLMIQSARRIGEYMNNPNAVIRFGKPVQRCIDKPAAPRVLQHSFIA
jgi:hypothetical protein